MTQFSDLALAEPISRALSTLGYDSPTPIQSEAIPALIDGRDLLGIAQTGTGKTAAFALPALHHIVTKEIDPPKRGARVLVLAPTRELVGQIHESFQSYGRFILPLTTAKVTGGVSINSQIKKLVRGNDVLIATPGRLIDLLDRKAISLAEVEMLILDEADQMMDMGFIHALKKIVPLLPKERQTVLLSATLPPKIKSLANQFLTDPVRVSVTPANTTAERIEQSLIFAKPSEKPMLLVDRLLQPEVTHALVFTRTKHGADRVVKRLASAGLRSLAIHGNKSQGQRQRALGAFKDGTVNILVATDVAARGIDISGISHVFNYEIPNVPEQYVHRIGRTARAEAEGRAIAFVAPDERAYLKDIEKLLGEPIPVEPMPEDMAERIQTIKQREAVDPVDIRPDTSRTGRGKSKRKKRKPTADKTSTKQTRVKQDNAPSDSQKDETGSKSQSRNRRRSGPRGDNSFKTSGSQPRPDKSRRKKPHQRRRTSGSNESRTEQSGGPKQFKRKPCKNATNRKSGNR